jgi:hypothetical protein
LLNTSSLLSDNFQALRFHAEALGFRLTSLYRRL